MRRLGLLVTGVLLMIGGTAFADDTSRGEFSGGWRYYHVTLRSIPRTVQVPLPKNFSKGWYADVAGNLSPKFAIVGEAGGTYFKDTVSNTTGPVSTRESFDLKFHTFMGGARVRAPQLSWFVPFGQVLFGAEHDTSTDERTLTVFQNTSTSHQNGNTTNPALALDSGVTIAPGRIGVRASVGYVRLFRTADADAFRVSLGGVFRF